jgi:hypothetical protein
MDHSSQSTNVDLLRTQQARDLSDHRLADYLAEKVDHVDAEVRPLIVEAVRRLARR